MEAQAIAQWAHDIRNTLGTVSLYLESLEHPHQDNRVGLLARSNALLNKASRMCSDMLQEAVQSPEQIRQRVFDVMGTIEDVLDFIAPNIPATTQLSLIGTGPVYALANPEDVFRILFNLIHNAVGVARTDATVRRISLSLRASGTSVVITIADDGPGLPGEVRAHLFQHSRSTTGGTGHGLSIARALAERNGATLELSDAERGAEFVLVLCGARPD